MEYAATKANTAVLKEPLGFIRVIQIPMAIAAFATTAGYSATMKIPYNCPKGPQSDSSPVEWGYPFDLTDVTVPINFCDRGVTGNVIPFTYGALSQSQFFVCTGVLSFLYGLTILAVYTLWWNSYTNDPRLPMADYGVTAVLALFWFISSCAWASGVSTVKTVTDPDVIGTRLRGPHGSYPCTTTELGSKMCIPEQTWNYASLNISLIIGFACCGLWVANLWFIYKETVWYKNRMAGKGAPTNAPGGYPFGGGAHPTAPVGGPGANVGPAASEFRY